MTYYACKDCPHNTTDHEHYAPRKCLVCDCQGMVNGEEYIKTKRKAVAPFVSKFETKDGTQAQ